MLASCARLTSSTGISQHEGDCILGKTIYLTGTLIDPSGAVYFSEQDLFPLNRTGAVIDGEWYTTPADPVAFLQASYGKDWSIPKNFVDYYKDPYKDPIDTSTG